jgi:hypothetical protein
VSSRRRQGACGIERGAKALPDEYWGGKSLRQQEEPRKGQSRVSAEAEEEREAAGRPARPLQVMPAANLLPPPHNSGNSVRLAEVACHTEYRTSQFPCLHLQRRTCSSAGCCFAVVQSSLLASVYETRLRLQAWQPEPH